ncbi:hypothetical protein BDZ89DRAFT_1114261 [Hymenopellis radicata]|nr:hypothetical protein BDZ89DRAFT_1114261 [Hymenopellis radicata]
MLAHWPLVTMFPSSSSWALIRLLADSLELICAYLCYDTTALVRFPCYELEAERLRNTESPGKPQEDKPEDEPREDDPTKTTPGGKPKDAPTKTTREDITHPKMTTRRRPTKTTPEDDSRRHHPAKTTTQRRPVKMTPRRHHPPEDDSRRHHPPEEDDHAKTTPRRGLPKTSLREEDSPYTSGNLDCPHYLSVTGNQQRVIPPARRVNEAYARFGA